MKQLCFFSLLAFVLTCNLVYGQTRRKRKPLTNHYDVIVYGGTASGVIAAYTAKQMGHSVLLIEPGERIGGLTTGGLGYTDIGNKYAIKGLSLDFYRRVGRHYGNFEQWIFEPHVAEQILWGYLNKANIYVLLNRRITGASVSNGVINDITVQNSTDTTSFAHFFAKEFIDCSYEGDLMAKAGVSYTVGREDNKQYSETYNGSQLREKHQFPDGIDPYKIPGHPESGLLWGVSNNKLLPDGTGNKMVQTYNIRVCLSKDPANSIPITQPDDYKPERYELLLRLLEKKPIHHIQELMTTSEMPNQKTDINNNGPFSTDMIGMSWNYPEADYEERAAIFKAHVNYTKGFFYFIGHDPRVPENLRNEMLQYGYPKDEYIYFNHFTPQMYVREARRMIGEYVMTQANCQGREVVKDGIALAAYTMDSHNAERLVVNGMVKNEGDVQIGGFGPYPISYRSITPKSAECTNLLVPVCLSASHIAFGSIRMEPVFMMLGQSAAVAAGLAIDQHTSVQSVDANQIQNVLITNPLADGSEPEILVMSDDPTAVTTKGAWKRETGVSGCFGPSLLINRSGGDGYAQFSPEIKSKGAYGVYIYVIKASALSQNIHINIQSQAGSKDIDLNLNNIDIEGQTEGKWVSIGSYPFLTGQTGKVTIFSNSTGGATIADALLFVPERK